MKHLIQDHKGTQLLSGNPESWDLAHDAQLHLKTQESVTPFKTSHPQWSARTTAPLRAVEAQLTLPVIIWILGRAKTIQDIQGWGMWPTGTRCVESYYLSIHECPVSRREQVGHRFQFKREQIPDGKVLGQLCLLDCDFSWRWWPRLAWQMRGQNTVKYGKGGSLLCPKPPLRETGRATPHLRLAYGS